MAFVLKRPFYDTPDYFQGLSKEKVIVTCYQKHAFVFDSREEAELLQKKLPQFQVVKAH